MKVYLVGVYLGSLNNYIMNFDKEDKDKQSATNPLNSLNQFLKRNGMNTFVSKTIVIWAFIFFAFWLGNACVGISQWGDSRFAMVAVMIFSWLPILLSNDKNFNS